MSTAPSKRSGTTASRAMRPVNNLVEKFIPSALVFAIVLTFIVALMAFFATGSGPVLIVQSWGDGLAGLLSFMTQMALVLMLGFMLANTRPVRKLLRALSSLPKSALSSYLFVFLVSAVASLITWGLGLVVGGLLAREIAAQARERGYRVHFFDAGCFRLRRLCHLAYGLFGIRAAYRCDP